MLALVARRRRATATIMITRSVVLVSVAAAAAIRPDFARAQIECTRSPVLPAYAHNDYENPHPLQDALKLGFRGVEADILLRGGELRVGHDAAETRAGRTLEAVYLRPLREIVQRCGHVLAGSTPFLLNIELKERSRATYDSLVNLLERYSDLFGSVTGGTVVPPVQVILVGWYPPLSDSIPPLLEHRLWRQQRITKLSAAAGTQSAAAVRLVSLDYGKTIAWSGHGPPPIQAARWLTRLRAAKDEGGNRLARVYNVPVDPAVYRLLLEGGVDLIGTKRLSDSHQVLLTLGLALRR